MQSLISVRMDDALKNNFDYICNELGMSMSTAITIFARKVCREKRIPFEVSINNKFQGESPMTNNIKYQVCLQPELSTKEDDTVSASFDNFESAMNFLRVEYHKMNEWLMFHSDEDYAKSRAEFSIKIESNQNMHSRLIVFDYEGLGYICDDRRTVIPYSDECEDSVFLDIVQTFMLGLLEQ